MHGEWIGDGVIRVALPDEIDPVALQRALRTLDGVHDVVVTEHHASVFFDGACPDLGGALDRVSQGITTIPGARHLVRVRYDGEDLDRVADATGLTRETVIAVHSGREYTVRVVGFVPGFAYLGDVDPRLICPRRSAPRTRVPAGSVALAGDRTGIYPSATPGGWNLLGVAVDFRAFDPERGAQLSLGDRVRFEPVP